MKNILGAFILLVVLLSTKTYSQELSGFAQFQLRYFPLGPLDDRQEGTGFSLAIQPEFYYDFGGSPHSLLFTFFARYDQHDKERTHYDIRELFWLYYSDNWEISVGFRKIFWGVTESQHLVDVINQTDFVENFNGEQKLGQPMINFIYIHDWGTLELFLLTGFRERTFPGEKGRFRFPILIDTENPIYESSSEYKHIDFAFRYVNYIGPFDFAISHFVGTSRAPRFTPIDSAGIEPYIQLNYDLMNQTGLEGQLTLGSWLWKFEGITRHTIGKRFYALTAGFEYTFSNISNTGLDVGVLGEWLYDDRDQFFFPPNPFKNHVFVGSRLAFNDVQSTEILAGVLVDYRGAGIYPSIEASRRVGESFIVNLEAIAFYNTEEGDLLHFFRRDNYLQLEINWYY
ncbi:MAG: hypothetical protein JSW63_04500 [Ignavibacterium sp.]|nr:MAG: hypothetical protein JSW63_04500 [Ignavibacterium sp.]